MDLPHVLLLARPGQHLDQLNGDGPMQALHLYARPGTAVDSGAACWKPATPW
jgi:hypothetical protein